MRIGLFGRGRLGSAILDIARRREGLEVIWAVDLDETPSGPVDVVIDASLAEAVEAHLAWACSAGTPLVIGTTGWTIPDLRERVEGRIGVLAASNFSLTVALMARLSLVLGRYAALDRSRFQILQVLPGLPLSCIILQYLQYALSLLQLKHFY